MSYLDHLLALAIFVLHPIVAYVSVKPIYQRIRAGETIERVKIYRQTIIQQWCLFILAMLLFFFQGRAWFVLEGSDTVHLGTVIAIVLTVSALALLFFQVRAIRRKTVDELAELRSQLGVLGGLLPHSREELKSFDLLSATAGIVEEVLWRGFLIWYLSHYVPVVVAALIGSVGFGLAHAYQGFSNVPKIVGVGMVLSALYILSGSLWLSILLHALGDMLQGRLAFEINRRGETA